MSSAKPAVNSAALLGFLDLEAVDFKNSSPLSLRSFPQWRESPRSCLCKGPKWAFFAVRWGWTKRHRKSATPSSCCPCRRQSPRPRAARPPDRVVGEMFGSPGTSSVRGSIHSPLLFSSSVLKSSITGNRRKTATLAGNHPLRACRRIGNEKRPSTP